MTRLFKHKIFLYLFTFLMVLLLEMALLIIVFNRAFPKYAFLEIIAIVILLAPMLLLKSNLASKIYGGSIFGIFSIFYVLNVTLDYASNDIFSLKYFQLAGEAASVFTMDYIHWGYMFILLALIVLLALGYYLSSKFYKYDKKENHQPILGISLVAIVLMLSLSIRSGIYDKIVSDNDDKAVYANKNGVEIIEFTSKNLKRSSLKNYGLINYTIGELGTITSVDNQIVVYEINDYLNNGKTLNSSNANSSYYGLLQNMNVITIMIETGCDFAVNEYLTPNLWRLRTEGLYFSNNLTKNKTNVSEYIGICGSATDTGVITKGCEVPFSLPRVLNEYGYETNYFHCNYSDFYQRGNVIDKLGFDNSYFVLDIAPELEWHNNYNGNYPLDTEFYEKIKEELIPESDEPFYSFWTTLSTHGPYVDIYGTKNKKKFTELGYYDKINEAEALGLWENPCSDDSKEVQNQIIRYQCAMMNFDDSLGMILDRLEETNQLDDTLLVLYGDHDIYYENLKYNVYNTDNPNNPEQYDTIMMMYNPRLTAKYKEVNKLSNEAEAVYSHFTSPYIIVPTTLELLGIEYNQNNYVGKSIFETKTGLDNIFYSHELNVFFTDKICGSDLENFDFINTEDENYIDLMRENALDLIYRIDMFNNMYNANYFGNAL